MNWYAKNPKNWIELLVENYSETFDEQIGLSLNILFKKLPDEISFFHAKVDKNIWKICKILEQVY